MVGKARGRWARWRGVVLVLCVLSALRARLRAREGGVSGAARIAYFIQASGANAHMLPRLLGALHAENHLYVVHFDSAVGAGVAADAMRAAMRVVGDARNVHVMVAEPVTYRGVTMMLNYVSGMAYAMRLGEWEYFVNLSGSDYPTAGAGVVAELLGAARGRCFVEWKPRGTWDGFAEKRLGGVYVDTAVAGNGTGRGVLLDSAGAVVGGGGGGGGGTGALEGVAGPFWRHVGVRVAKTSGWFVLNREVCDYFVRSGAARRMVALFALSDASDEHYFGTLLWNERRFRRASVPDNMRNVFFVAPNGSFAMGAGGVRSRQHPFYVDESAEDGSWLFWQSLVERPAFFTRKVRGVAGFRERVDAEMLGRGARADRAKVAEYEDRLRTRFRALIRDADADADVDRDAPRARRSRERVYG